MSFIPHAPQPCTKPLHLQSPRLTPRPLHFYKAIRGASLSSRDLPPTPPLGMEPCCFSHIIFHFHFTNININMKMKFTNINLLLSASATTVIITAPLISAQVSLSYSICFVAFFINSISLSYMSSYHHFPWLRLSFSLSISIWYDRLLAPHRGSSTLSTRKAIGLLLSTISMLQTTSTSAMHGRGIIYAAKLDSNLGKTQLGPAILKMTQSRRGSWRGHWLGGAAVLQ